MQGRICSFMDYAWRTTYAWSTTHGGLRMEDYACIYDTYEDRVMLWSAWESFGELGVPMGFFGTRKISWECLGTRWSLRNA